MGTEPSLNTGLHLLHVLVVESPVQICLVELVDDLLLVLDLLSLQFFKVRFWLQLHLRWGIIPSDIVPLTLQLHEHLFLHL